MLVTTGHGSLPTPPVLDIGDRCFSSPKVATHTARHRLPVFLTMREDVDKSAPAGGRSDTVASENHSSQSLEPTIPMSSVLNPYPRTRTHGTRSPTIEAMCGGVCDGVTCMLATSKVSDAPCLRTKGHSDGGCAGDTSSMSSLPDSDELCPFHHIPSMWLVLLLILLLSL